MAAKFNREATLQKIQLMQKRLEASLKDVLKHADRAEKSVHSLLKGIDKDKAQQQFVHFLSQSRSEIDGVRGKIEKQIATLKAQAKAIADAERAKRRARRGS
jgi:SRSO17 transposase